MTRGDRIRAWNDLQLASFLATIEKKAAEHNDILNNMSEGTLAGDWLLFLAKADDHEHNT